MNIEDLKLTEEQIAGVQKLIQSAEDRVRTDYSQKLKDANAELAKYKPSPKSETEKALEQRIAQLEQREADIAKKERTMTVANALKAKGLPEGLGEYLNIGEDIEADIEKVGAALGNYFLHNSAKPSDHRKSQGTTKEQFRKMSYNERMELFNSNPELYKALSARK